MSTLTRTDWVAVAIAVTACGGRPRPTAVLAPICLSAPELAAARARIAPDVDLHKLDPGLRALVRDLQSDPPLFRCVPPSIAVLVEVRGPLDALEALGFATRSIIPHTDGNTLATGDLATARLADLAAMERVVAVEGSGHYAPDRR